MRWCRTHEFLNAPIFDAGDLRSSMVSRVRMTYDVQCDGRLVTPDVYFVLGYNDIFIASANIRHAKALDTQKQR